jgi:hypothetical protein
VHDQQVGSPVDCLPGDLDRRVDREHHPVHVGFGMTGDEPDRVPGLGGVGRVPGVQQVDDVGEAGHARRLDDATRRRTS